MNQALGLSNLVLQHLFLSQGLEVYGIISSALVGRFGQRIQNLLLSIEPAESEPEGNHGDEGDARNDDIEPGEEGILAQRHKGLRKSGRDGVGEQKQARHERAHVARRLCEGVLERRDQGHDLR